MFGILFLVIVPIGIYLYISIFRRIIVAQNNAKIKAFITAVVFGGPIAYPFLFLISPNYIKFQSLCDDNKYTLFQSISTDIFPAPYFGEGYKALVEKPYNSFVHRNKLYSPNKKWKSEQCFQSCSKGQQWKCMENQCLKVELSDGVSYPDYRSVRSSKNNKGFLNSTLIERKTQLVGSDNSLLAERYSYTFYPYGTGWARMLGAASGSAPSFNCKSYSRFNYYEITPPK